MWRPTVADFIASRAFACLDVDPLDPRLLQWLNAATERLLYKGHWRGTTETFRIQATGGLITLPAEIETPEQLAVCGDPIPLRNQWFEFNPGGWGVISDPGDPNCPTLFSKNALRRNNACTFLDIPTTAPTPLCVICDVAADAGVTSILLLGFDASGNWVRTKTNGIWQDGETVLLAQGSGSVTATTFSRLTGIQKPVTNGQLWLRLGSSTGTLIGHYQYWEINPTYPRYLVPILPNQTAQVAVLGKLAFRPVVNATDWLIIPHLEAMRLGAMAVKLEGEHKLEEAALLMNGKRDAKGKVLVDGALTLLDEQVGHARGEGEQATVRWSGSGAVLQEVPTVL